MFTTGQTIKAQVKITAHRESLIIHPEGETIDALVIEARRQLDFVVASHWKWFTVPIRAKLCVTINGNETCRPVEARTIRKLIAQAKAVLEEMLRQDS